MTSVCIFFWLLLSTNTFKLLNFDLIVLLGLKSMGIILLSAECCVATIAINKTFKILCLPVCLYLC